MQGHETPKGRTPIESAEGEIAAEMSKQSKALDPKAKSRWRQGYLDGLAEALKIIGKHKGESDD